MTRWGKKAGAPAPAVPAAAEPVVPVVPAVEAPKVAWVGNGCPVEPCMKGINHAGPHTQGGVS